MTSPPVLLHITRSEIVQHINQHSAKISRTPSLKVIEKKPLKEAKDLRDFQTATTANDEGEVETKNTKQPEAPLYFFRRPQKFLPVLVMNEEDEKELCDNTDSPSCSSSSSEQNYSKLQRAKLKQSKSKSDSNATNIFDVYVVIPDSSKNSGDSTSTSVEKKKSSSDEKEAKFTTKHTRSYLDNISHDTVLYEAAYESLFGDSGDDEDPFGLELF